MMNDSKLLRTGSIGTAIAAICCFTPVLVVVVGFAGLSAIVMAAAAPPRTTTPTPPGIFNS